MRHRDLGSFQHYWFPIVIVGGLVLLTTWLGRVADHPLIPVIDAVGHDPDYFVDDMKAVAYDKTGVPRYHLEVKRLLHYMDDNTTTLESPNFLRDGPGVARVAASADRGKVSPDGEIVYLLDQVRMRQDSLNGGMPLDLSTEYLEIFPNQDRLATDRPVVITQGKSRLTGNSMKADGRARTFEMDGHVKGIYENRS